MYTPVFRRGVQWTLRNYHLVQCEEGSVNSNTNPSDVAIARGTICDQWCAPFVWDIPFFFLHGVWC